MRAVTTFKALDRSRRVVKAALALTDVWSEEDGRVSVDAKLLHRLAKAVEPYRDRTPPP